ncbi:MAG: ribonuclease HII, partial [Anaerolineae bacterium]|nr:ribonuclease HII [Anaerolineae bacterium]
MPAKPHLKKEIALLKQGFRFIAGVDEAGRGAWAGPVVAAAVILPLERADLAAILSGLNDSKKLTPRQRESLFDIIQQIALAIGVGLASARMVDQINVVEATRQAMGQALAQLRIPPTYLLLDHLTLPATALPQQAFPKADGISLSVAAASVIAKVTRDRMLVDFNQTYPGYAFDRHKGYGTRLHQAALKQLGACPIHR